MPFLECITDEGGGVRQFVVDSPLSDCQKRPIGTVQNVTQNMFLTLALSELHAKRMISTIGCIASNQCVKRN